MTIGTREYVYTTEQVETLLRRERIHTRDMVIVTLETLTERDELLLPGFYAAKDLVDLLNDTEDSEPE